MIRRWFIGGILVAVMISLLWTFYSDVVVYSPMDSLKRTEKAPPEGPKPLEPYDPAWRKDILSKNLFSRQREYAPLPRPETPAEVRPEPEAFPPNLSLSGIILDQYGEFSAYIQTDGEPPKQVREGDVFDDILVVHISEREVKLLWNDQEIDLNMNKIKTLPR